MNHTILTYFLLQISFFFSINLDSRWVNQPISSHNASTVIRGLPSNRELTFPPLTDLISLSSPLHLLILRPPLSLSLFFVLFFVFWFSLYKRKL